MQFLLAAGLYHLSIHVCSQCVLMCIAAVAFAVTLGCLLSSGSQASTYHACVRV